MSIIRCFDCPTAISTTAPVPAAVSLCSECAHERGITVEIADVVAKLDAEFANPAAIWEAVPRDMFKFMWDCAWEGVRDMTESEGWAIHAAARRVVYALNVMWFGPESILK